MRYVLFLTGLFFTTAFAQQPNIENYLYLVETGHAEEVRAELPSLLNQYPTNVGIQYLQAMLTTDGAEAVRLYQNIVDNSPKSEWADDALYKVYKFYYAIGLYRTAEIKLTQLRANYPDSKYVTSASEADTHDLTEQKPAEHEARNQQPVPASNQKPDVSQEGTRPKADDIAATVAPSPAPVSPVNFTLQVGVYSTRANANKQKHMFDYHKYPAEVVSKMKGDRELFAVYVGKFSTSDEAKAKGDEIKNAFNIDYIVVTR